MKTIVSMLALFALMIACDSPGPSPDARTAEPDPNAHAFYYPWWGNPETDGAYFHWNHEILGVGSKTRSYPGGDDIGANFYPELGCYSSHDSATVNTHMKQLKQAGIGTICVSWWGPDSFEDKAIPLILDKAANHGIKVNFHIEPFEGRNAATTRDAIIYLTDTYGAHPAFQRDPRYNNRPFLYIYDSYKTPASEWATILDPAGTNTIRGTAYDAVMIALWVEPHEEDFILQGNFDGFYTYFVSDSFSYGSSPSTWPKLSSWAKQNDKVFVPCVGPGYSDTRIRPWNHSNYRSRDGGKYYDRMFTTAINVKPPVIGVTSFNEWHEGTQIEPAVPYAAGEYVYEDYEPRPNDYYLHRTRYWVDKIGQIIPVEKENVAAMNSRNIALGRSYKLDIPCSQKYDGGSDSALTDGMRGSTAFRDGRWVGFERTDMIATVDLEETKTISKISVCFLQDESVWIFQPRELAVLVSTNGEKFESVAQLALGDDERSSTAFVSHVQADLQGIKARYVKILAENRGTLPETHPSAGGKTWLFADEIVIE